MRIGSYVQTLCTALCTARAAPRPSARSLPHGAVATRDRATRFCQVPVEGSEGYLGGSGGLERLWGLMSRGVEKPQAKRVFSRLPTCTCIVFGRVPCPENRYIANYTLADGDGDDGFSRARSAARAFRRVRPIFPVI